MEIKEKVQLETKRLILRQLVLEDAEAVFRNWTSDSEVSKYMRWETHKSINVTREWIQEEIDKTDNNTHYNWGIVLKEINEPIGSIGAFKSEENGRMEVGYGISRKYWNKGYTSEALKCVMEYLINTNGVKKFVCKHAIKNPASGAVMQKVGFKYVKDTFYESLDGKKRYNSKMYYLDI